MENKEIDIRREQIEDYADFLREQERAKAQLRSHIQYPDPFPLGEAVLT